MPAGKKGSGKKKRWVAKVTTDSTHPPKGLFTKSAPIIARDLGVREGIPQRGGIGDANADVFHQSSWPRPER